MTFLPTNRRTRWILGLLASWVLIGCTVERPAAWYGLAEYAQRVPATPEVVLIGGPRLPHDIHAENDIECTDCHEVDEETGRPSMPVLEFCWDCHEDIDEEKPEAERINRVYFDEDEKPRWRVAVRKYGDELRWNHKAHASLEGGCAACHKDMGSTEGRPDAMLFDMAGCESCHEKNAAPRECSTCHTRLDRETAPPTHTEGTWRFVHGRAARLLRGTATAQDCSLCHLEPVECDTCHQQQAPRDHSHLWDKRHGQMVRAAGGSFPARCAFCHHERAFCEKCHFDQEPRSHTALFRTRTHGMLAAMDRQSCATCHQVHFCQRCHEDTPPRSHRAGWAMGRSTHCVQCHVPISSNPSCQVCHRTNPTHSTAPAQPVGHIPGRNCRVCHNAAGAGGARPLRHLDNGQNCESCHR